jgi:hypothetical protein
MEDGQLVDRETGTVATNATPGDIERWREYNKAESFAGSDASEAAVGRDPYASKEARARETAFLNNAVANDARKVQEANASREKQAGLRGGMPSEEELNKLFPKPTTTAHRRQQAQNELQWQQNRANYVTRMQEVAANTDERRLTREAAQATSTDKRRKDAREVLEGLVKTSQTDPETGKVTEYTDHNKLEGFTNDLYAREAEIRKQFGVGPEAILDNPEQARKAFANYERRTLKSRKAMEGVSESSLFRSDPKNIGDITGATVRPSRLTDAIAHGVGPDGVPTHNAIGLGRAAWDTVNPFASQSDGKTVELMTSEGHRKLVKYSDLINGDAGMANYINMLDTENGRGR